MIVSSRFNEAAGIPRGRRREAYVEVGKGNGASMRPRVFPAEDAAVLDAIDPLIALQ